MSTRLVIDSIKKSIYYCAKFLPIFQPGKPKLRIVMYHGVDNIRFPRSTFKQHLAFYTKHFETFFAKEIPTLLQNNCKTPSGKPPLVLTFDDGLKNNATIVAPLIKEFNAKATFYLISGLLEGGKMMWNHELTCRLLLLSDTDRAAISPELSVADQPTNDCDTILKERIKHFINKVKRWPDEEKYDLLRSLQDQIKDPIYTDEMIQRYEIMSTEDAKALPDCIEIGSHSVSHSILDTIPTTQGISEVANSKIELEALLERQIETFCYPNGNYTTDVAAAVAKHYSVGVTTEEGFAYPRDQLNLLNRISSRIELYEMCARLIMPR